MKYLTFGKLINYYNKSSIGIQKIFLCFIDGLVNYKSLIPGKLFSARLIISARNSF